MSVIAVCLCESFTNGYDCDSTERNFQVGKYLELEFEFRTSEMNGVLLSVSEPNGFPALSIELYGGKVSDLGGRN